MRCVNEKHKEKGGARATSVMTKLQRKLCCQLARLLKSMTVLRRVEAIEQRLEHHAIFKSGAKMLSAAKNQPNRLK